jgi:hypothetical protein
VSKTKELWPGWFYGSNGESAVFKSEGEVPDGWFDSPQKATEHAAKKGSKKAAKTVEVEHDI